MDAVYVLRERLQEIYARNSKIFDKGIQFLIALITFMVINQNVGFMNAASSPVVALILAVICTFLPMLVTVMAATVLILAHMYAVSLGILAVTAVVFLIMYIFYIRLTPKMALVVLLTPLAFALKAPLVIPVACALLLTPISIVAIVCGAITYYMMEYVKKTAASIEGSGIDGILSQVTAFLKQVFQSKEMWIIIAASIVAFFVVYTVRRLSIDHAWKIAIIAGAIVNVVVVVAGNIAFSVSTSYGSLIGGSVAAVAVGLILEILFFTVDYARSENLQYEDDEYYYYVKAIPKISVATPEKTVKRINERQETEIIDAEEVRKKANKNQKPHKGPAKAPAKQSGSSVNVKDMKEVDKMLLTQSLENDLK